MVRARGTSRLGSLQAGQLVARGACPGGDADEEATRPVDADPAGSGDGEAGPVRTRRAGNVAAEAAAPPEAGGEEQAVQWRADQWRPAGSSSPGRHVPRGSAPDRVHAGWSL